MRVTVLGNGGWGTAVALRLVGNGHPTTIWGHDATYLAEVARQRVNSKYLPGIPLPDALRLVSDPAEALDGCELLLAAIPVQHIRKALAPFADAPRDVPMVSLAKGIEIETFSLPTEIFTAVTGDRPVASLSGPSHAEEVARHQPTSLVAASEDAALTETLSKLLTDETFRIYTNDDLKGVELAGALKNIIGLAGGVCDGLAFGDNAKAALLTRGLVEIARFGVGLGARRETFSGLAGVGDMITTCFSPYGRNRRVGEMVGKGLSLDEVLATTAMVAEGVRTTEAVTPKARAMGVEMPITFAVHEVLFEGLDPRMAVQQLMARDLRDELEL